MILLAVLDVIIYIMDGIDGMFIRNETVHFLIKLILSVLRVSSARKIGNTESKLMESIFFRCSLVLGKCADLE